jgi:hypothetical protein
VEKIEPVCVHGYAVMRMDARVLTPSAHIHRVSQVSIISSKTNTHMDALQIEGGMMDFIDVCYACHRMSCGQRSRLYCSISIDHLAKSLFVRGACQQFQYLRGSTYVCVFHRALRDFQRVVHSIFIEKIL